MQQIIGVPRQGGGATKKLILARFDITCIKFRKTTHPAMKPFPPLGSTRAQIDASLDAMVLRDAKWRDGRVPLYVFGGDSDAYEVGRDAFFRFFSENALGARRAFGSVRAMEQDLVEMGLSLFNGHEKMAGIVTSGGSESIFLAVRAARAEARASRGLAKGIGNLVLPETAHPAFTKAAQSMDLEERRIPVMADGRAAVDSMEQAIDAETVMLVGSAPCFPYGVIDPIERLGQVALARRAWLHVDACVGGYLAPFARELGYPIPAFDLAVPGVSSLSADLHKYGFCPKPASTVFFSSQARSTLAGFDMDVWPSGRFVTSTLVGTRPAGGVAGAWATIQFLGAEGYRKVALQVMQMRDAYLDGIKAIPGYRMAAEPDLAVMAFGDPAIDMMRVAALMNERGWVPGTTSRPAGLHLMLSLLHVKARESYLADLTECSRLARAEAANGPVGARASATY